METKKNSAGLGKVVIGTMRALMGKYMPLMLSCRQFDAFIVDYLDGNLSGLALAQFHVHLRMCPSCRSYLREYQKSLLISKAAFNKFRSSTEMPADLQEAILAALASEAQAAK